MPVGYKIRADFSVMVATFYGDVVVDEIRDALLDYQKDPGFDGRYCVLADLADCSFPEGNFDDYVQLAYRLRSHFEVRDPNSRTAFFAPEDVGFGISRMYQTIAADRASYTMEVFRTAEEALRFVRVDPQAPGAADLLRRV
ncbi:hypothetical protein [Puniceibacterium sediminis]|uniref:SpoIIAA-like n=1 Tax=Puniceibacterium sediminis TaxID=1608407 RepID=A0A238Y613_9RHOB|nr:hypothetical protein [Puniceibacterium sediminis]SNR65779.1 hypothetical protein SAMN06265370_11499 [Puniceibacterium sediminis]